MSEPEGQKRAADGLPTRGLCAHLAFPGLQIYLLAVKYFTNVDAKHCFSEWGPGF